MKTVPTTTGRTAKNHFTWLSFLLLATVVRGADSDVVINEIMYHPPRQRDDLQYVELFNRGAAPVDLSGWSFSKGIRFVFPAQTKLAPGGYVVVARDAEALAAQYGREIVALGNFTNSLSHGGERLELVNAQNKLVEAVKYSDREGWPMGADGHSASLERICPKASAGERANWAASNLSPTKQPAGTPGRRNESYSENLPPIISGVTFAPSAPKRRVTVSATIADADGVKAAALLFRVATPGRPSEETSVPFTRVSGDARRGVYEASIERQGEGELVRFRVQAADAAGTERIEPGANEPSPTFSCYSGANTNTARIPFGFILHLSSKPARPAPSRFAGARINTNASPRGEDAFIYMPPGGGEIQVFDHVAVKTRRGGFKVHFRKGQPFHGMSAINLFFEASPRWVLAEPLAYELYRRAGVPAELTEHARLWVDGRGLGYHLVVEQPNRSFLARNDRDDSGHLYKLLWYGRDIVGKHEKKTHQTGGHDGLIKLLDGLEKTSGAEQWEFIRKQFNVEEFINYFAVNMCLQNWDGFHNNYFTYHDTGGTGKWEIYPWDEDKTWGDYDGASPQHDWYEMPLTYGMRGAVSPPLDPKSKGNNARGSFGGVAWWRAPGHFSGPLLANPEFRQRFLARLREICLTVFTEEKFMPVIDALEKRLEPEIPVRAALKGEDASEALQSFRADMESFRNQLRHRREFILSELKRE